MTSYRDERSAVLGAVERAAEALEAEFGAIVVDGVVTSSVGFGLMPVPETELRRCIAGELDRFEVPDIGLSHVMTVPIEGEGTFVLGRVDDPFTREEEALLRSMGRALSMACTLLRVIESERDLRERSETQTAEIEALLSSLVERQQLLERLSRIQSSISHRQPLQEVLDSITQGAVELLNSEVVGLRMIDPEDPGYMITLSSQGVSEQELRDIWRLPVGTGAGGRAITENRLIVIEQYDKNPAGLPAFRELRMQTAMAAPVHENGIPTGSLVVASYRTGRRFSEEEKAILLAFAEHASLALTDAKTVEAMREAQRSRDMFLAMVSHELKTPLTVIMGTLRTLERFTDSISSEERAQMLSAAYERGRDLQRLIDRLLQGASAELAEAARDVFLPDLIAEAVRGFEHSFRLKVDEVPEITLELNSASIERLIGILVENAVAHSPVSTTIFLGVDLAKDALSIWVENQGTLPVGDPEDLFEPFHRGDEATSSGVGLGLYIAKRIAQSMNGDLTATENLGSVRFTFTVPLRKSTYLSAKGPAAVAEAFIEPL